MATNRNMKMPGVWAKDALTTIPQPPVSGIAYRNDNLTEAEANEGQKYGSIGDSAVWNQELWAATTLLKELESQGILSWSPLVDYSVNAMVMGSNDKLYSALQASGPSTAPQDPVNDSTQTYWIPMEDLYGAKRNPGELVYSMLPIEDASLHLVDGTVLSGSGMYADFVSYVAGLIDDQPNSSNVYKVGNLADVDNVLSGFTTSSYAKLPFSFSPGSSPWEMVFKIKTGGDVTTSQAVFASSIIKDAVTFGINSGKFFAGAASDTSTSIFNAAGTYSVQTNTNYYIRVKFTGSAYTLDYSLDGSSYVTDITYTSSTPVFGGYGINLGIDYNSSLQYTKPFLGTIDLTGSYININGSRWWSGTHKAGFMDETEWQATVSKYKACGCFVYDEVANTLRLPKVTGFLEGTVDPSALGTLVEAGSPNITGDTGSWIAADAIANNGALYKTSTVSIGIGFSSGTSNRTGVGIDASRSSAVYGNSDTVQPQAIKGFVYMVVSNRTKTQIVADIDEIAADLQLKADVDLGNVTSVGNARMAHAAMPSGQYESLTVPANGGTVTAPADGWICLRGTANTSSAISFLMLVNSNSKIYTASHATSQSYTPDVYLPCSNGDIIRVNYDHMNGLSLTFAYANGSAS